MVELIVVGFLSGVITGLSPCVLPIIPVIMAGSAVGRSRHRPLAIVTGLVMSFTIFTLLGTALLSALGLPSTLLRTIGLIMLFVLAAGLLIPHLGYAIERPFARWGTRRYFESSSGLVLGFSLGLLFVPCAGPVLAVISVIAASRHLSVGAFILTLAYSIGAAVPLYFFAWAAQRTTTKFQLFRSHARRVRQVAGVVIGAMALAIMFNVTAPLQRITPSITGSLQNDLGRSGASATLLHKLERVQRPSGFQVDKIVGISSWLNTPDDRPITMRSLRGRVVLVDFWTYSCINCQRSLPHVEAWYHNYKKFGFEVIGIHTPEFTFEHDRGNVIAAAKQLGVTYPIALDNNYSTWNSFLNEAWPAEYLFNASGYLMYWHYGEGDYSFLESAIRTLLHHAGVKSLPATTEVSTVHVSPAVTPESYVGYARVSLNANGRLFNNEIHNYHVVRPVPPNEFAFGGTWRVGSERAKAIRDAVIELHFTAKSVHLVLGGRGTIDVYYQGHIEKKVRVTGVPNLYTLLSRPVLTTGNLKLRFSKGIEAYDFTFG